MFPDNVKQLHARLKGPKELVWLEGNQIDFYDKPELVEKAASAATRWFDGTLRA